MRLFGEMGVGVPKLVSHLMRLEHGMDFPNTGSNCDLDVCYD